MRAAKWILCVLVGMAGCTQVDENPKWDPKELPEWAYDAPWYYRPAEDLQVKESVEPGIPVYYTNEEYFFIVHPGGYQVSGAPRMAVWSSLDQGKNWQKTGYYGVEQTHFLFAADADGPYWIRFVGPGQPPSEIPPGMPNRIYVVDRKPPEIIVAVDPPPWQDKERTKPYVYRTGQTVEISWSVQDANLAQDTIKLGMAYANFPNDYVFMEIPDALQPSGTVSVEVPAEALGNGGVRFRIRATDKADNVGVGVTEVLRVRADEAASQPAPSGEPSTQPATAEVPGAGEPAAEAPAPATAPIEPKPATNAPATAPIDPEPATRQIEPPAPAPAREEPAGTEPAVQASAIEPQSQPAGQAATPPPLRFKMVVANKPAKPVLKPVQPFDIIHQVQGTPGEKLGWPMGGAVLRGGTYQVLGWLPETAATYESGELQFSSNDGRSWATLATGLKFGQPVRWTVPMLTSRACRLRIVAQAKDGARYMLVQSGKFAVETVLADTTLGPTSVELTTRPANE